MGFCTSGHVDQHLLLALPIAGQLPRSNCIGAADQARLQGLNCQNLGREGGEVEPVLSHLPSMPCSYRKPPTSISETTGSCGSESPCPVCP